MNRSSNTSVASVTGPGKGLGAAPSSQLPEAWCASRSDPSQGTQLVLTKRVPQKQWSPQAGRTYSSRCLETSAAPPGSASRKRKPRRAIQLPQAGRF
eukprot:CAMPEP_0181537696 /NCGR_PEP_ID=MMETSP1110-20121109/75484_1 /TAXON_ID=174948 /ORGANISM="Symbiodinium sp., Strain CCMP421" /LENGTH=96 /DNA_ID=CAMNT_0023669275 /DNA_START=480 /DNA_END=768 /DNA_ORIENTATION=-